MKNKFLRKILGVSLCAALAGSTAVTMPVFVPRSSIAASAADTLTYGDFEYSVSDNEVIITEYKGTGGKVTIPSKIEGKTVTSIGESANGFEFIDNSSIAATGVTLSQTSLTIEKGRSVTLTATVK